MSRNNRTIQFSVNSYKKKKEIDNYAEKKGFGKAGTLAQVALFQYMAKNPLKQKEPVKPPEKTKAFRGIKNRKKTSSLYSLKHFRSKKKGVTTHE